MRIALDISHMHKLSRDRGIGIYAKNLYEALKKHSQLDISLLEKEEDYKKFDLIHFPFFDLFAHTLPLKLPKPFIVTIHDLIPLMFPKYYPSGIRGKINWLFQQNSLKKSKKIIAVSNTVKGDIEKILKLDPDKISVIYSAPSDSFKKINDTKMLNSIRSKYQLPKEFVLYIGNVNWNKNILNTTESVLNTNKNLVIIGSAFNDKSNLLHPEKKSFKNWLTKYEKNNRIKVLGFTPVDEIVAIMNLASCLIFVSFYEGFGLPILEAQACSLPVITSDVSATREIAGKGAILVSPEKIDEITASINNLFGSESLRQKLINLGKENVSQFSWRKTALETVRIYENALS